MPLPPFVGPASAQPESSPSTLSAGGPAPRVLIIDDEKNIRSTLTVCFQSLACSVVAVATPEAALEAVGRQPFDLAFLDLKLGKSSGLDLIQQLLVEQPSLAIVLMTAYATIDTAVDAMRRGAWHYLPKPFSPAQLRQLLEQHAQTRQLELQKRALEEQLASEVPATDLATSSLRMRAVLQMLERAAAAEVPVLLRGENGTGKGVLARVLHLQSPRKRQPFVVVNCPTLSEELLASELFGHTRGAFTGAVRDQVGRVEAAQGGTLFLDEIGEISPGLQAKLLRFVQDRTFERLGDTRTRHANVRVVAATNRDLEADVRAGRFREDLLFRLNVIELKVPSLRERPEDILPLARRFLHFFCLAAGRPPAQLTPATEAILQSYAWPGNVRELRNAMERASILWSASALEPQALPERIVGQAEPGPRVGGDFTLEELERAHILRVIQRSATLEEAARILSIEPSTLWRKRKKYEEG